MVAVFWQRKDAATLSCALKNQFNSGFDNKNTQQLFSWRSPRKDHHSYAGGSKNGLNPVLVLRLYLL